MPTVKFLKFFELKKQNFIYFLISLDILLFIIDIITFTYIFKNILDINYIICEIVADSLMIIFGLVTIFIYHKNEKIGTSLKFYSFFRICLYILCFLAGLGFIIFLIFFDKIEKFEFFWDNKSIYISLCVFVALWSLLNVFWSFTLKDIVQKEIGGSVSGDDKNVSLDATEEIEEKV